MPNRTEAASRKLRHAPPGGCSNCACSRLHKRQQTDSCLFASGHLRPETDTFLNTLVRKAMLWSFPAKGLRFALELERILLCERPIRDRFAWYLARPPWQRCGSRRRNSR